MLYIDKIRRPPKIGLDISVGGELGRRYVNPEVAGSNPTVVNFSLFNPIFPCNYQKYKK